MSESPAEGVPAEGEVRNGPRSRKGVQTRARLVDAAKEIFEEHGFLDARIADIAERAGLSHGSFYHYFDSKEQIFREVVETVDDHLSESMYQVVLRPAPGTTAFDRLYTAIRSHFERYRDEARIMGVIEHVSRYDDEVAKIRLEHRERYRTDVTNSIRQMQRRGIADSRLDPDVAAIVLGSMMERFTEAFLVEGAVDTTVDDAARNVATIYVNALQIKDEPADRARKTAKGK